MDRAIRPEVHNLVELGDLRLPQPDVLRIFLTDRHDRFEVAEPLSRLAHLSAICPELVDMAAVRWGLEGERRGEDLVLLGE
jgi:hypothetical protein